MLKIFFNIYSNSQAKLRKKYINSQKNVSKNLTQIQNAVKSVNSALRKVTRGKGAFPNENSVYKVMYLRLKELSEKWKKPIPNWKTIQPQLIELFGERYIKHLEI